MSFQNSGGGGVGSSQLNFQQDASHRFTPELRDQLVLLDWKISLALSYQLNQSTLSSLYSFLKARNRQIRELADEFDQLEISKKLSNLNTEQQEEMDLIFQVWSNRILLEKRFIWFRAVVDKEFARFLNKEGDHNRQAYVGYLYGLGEMNRVNNELSLVEHFDFVEHSAKHLDSVESPETAKEPETGSKDTEPKKEPETGSKDTNNEPKKEPEAGSKDTNNEPKKEPETGAGSSDTSNELKKEPETGAGSSDTSNELKKEPETGVGSSDTSNELKKEPETEASSGGDVKKTEPKKNKKSFGKKVMKKVKKLFQ